MKRQSPSHIAHHVDAHHVLLCDGTFWLSEARKALHARIAPPALMLIARPPRRCEICHHLALPFPNSGLEHQVMSLPVSLRPSKISLRRAPAPKAARRRRHNIETRQAAIQAALAARALNGVPVETHSGNRTKVLGLPQRGCGVPRRCGRGAAPK